MQGDCDQQCYELAQQLGFSDLDPPQKEEKDEESNVTTVIKPLLEKENIEYTISSI